MRKSIILSALFCAASFADAVAQNPFLPLWEYIPDGEPYVFEDPDRPGNYRVYVYGSHDSEITRYCGLEQVTWSAPVDNLTDWRYDGVILRVTHDRDGKQLRKDGTADLLYAPDVTVVNEADGTKTYYLFPNNQTDGRRTMVAKSKRPDGPFTVCNWSEANPRETFGCLDFDPGVFVDDDGRVYAYWGFEKSYAAELDPSTMASVKPGTKIVEDLIPNYKQDGVFRFFEASSMRKIEDKYVFIYSRWTEEGENGLPSTNYTLAYAYGDNPLGPFTYGGTIIDGRGRDIDPKTGNTIVTATSGGNTHGSIFEANGQWWVVYHRQTGTDEYSRQAMAAPITVSVEKGKGGKVTISEAEYTSEGFAINGLNPYQRIPAGIACYYTGTKPARNEYPHFIHAGSYIQPSRLPLSQYERSYSLNQGVTPVVNNTAGSVVGYKYLNFNQPNRKPSTMRFTMTAKPLGVSGTVRLMVDAPTEEQGGKQIGTLTIDGTLPQVATEFHADVNVPAKNGKRPFFLVFESDTKEQSLCELYNFIFE